MKQNHWRQFSITLDRPCIASCIPLSSYITKECYFKLYLSLIIFICMQRNLKMPTPAEKPAWPESYVLKNLK